MFRVLCGHIIININAAEAVANLSRNVKCMPLSSQGEIIQCPVSGGSEKNAKPPAATRGREIMDVCSHERKRNNTMSGMRISLPKFGT